MENLGFDLLGRRGGNHLELFVQDCDASGEPLERTLDACKPDEGIWIYPSSFQPARESLHAEPL